MSYFNKLQIAIATTKKYGLNVDESVFHSEPEFSDLDRQDIIDICYHFLELKNVRLEHLIQNCAGLHSYLVKKLKNHDVYCDVTIGQVFVNDKPWLANASEQALIEELNNPNIESDINFHVWISFRDGTIIEWTLKPERSSQKGVIETVNTSFICIPPNTNHSELRYEPILVGLDYLTRIEAI